MRVGKKISFQDYWEDPQYRDKRPIRNGSRKMLVGDNIYHRQSSQEGWIQEDSHHSHPDGTANISNLTTDTSADAVLISDTFYYFGKAAPEVPKPIFEELGYRNARNYRVFDVEPDGIKFISWIQKTFLDAKDTILEDPFDFNNSHARYSAATNKVKM